jgi:hypothetical protein
MKARISSNLRSSLLKATHDGPALRSSTAFSVLPTNRCRVGIDTVLESRDIATNDYEHNNSTDRSEASH